MKKVFRSNIKGAVFVARHTGWLKYKVWPAEQGLTKLHGCVWFNSAKGALQEVYHYITRTECKNLYNDYPPGSTAWLVYLCKNGKDCWWEQVDDLIDFS